MRIPLISVVLVAAIGLPRSLGSVEPTTKPAPQLVGAILDAIRHPSAGQFSSAESVVKFLLEQVQRQDLDEATKAFPIVETYERYDLINSARYLRILDPNGSPIPQASFRNLSLAMRPLAYFDQISLALLGFDMSHVTVLKDGGSVAELKEIVSKADRSRLAKIEIGSITAGKAFPIQPTDTRANAIHITARTEVTGLVKGAEGKHLRLTFLVEQIDENWRIVNCQIATEREGN